MFKFSVSFNLLKFCYKQKVIGTMDWTVEKNSRIFAEFSIVFVNECMSS